MDEQVKQRIEQLNNGEIPKGYKKTDFGIFPSDWVTDKTLGDLFDFYGGLSKSRDELGEKGYAYLHYGDMHRGSFNTVSIDQYEQLPKCDISLTEKEKCLMKDGDVAFLDASEDLEGTSRAVLIDNPENKPFIAGLHIIYGKAKDNSLDKWFKQYITSSESVKKQFQRLAVGFKVYGVNRDTIPRIQVAYPPSNKEQSLIAEILMKWDEAIELYDKQIDALTRYKAVCLKKMFPAKGQNVPEWRFQGFTGDWEKRKVGDLVKHHNAGIYISKENYGKGINVVGVGNIYDKDIFDGEIYRLGPVDEDKFLLDEDDLIYGESSLVLEGIARTVCVGKNGAGSAFAWHTRRVKLNNDIVDSHFATLELNYHPIVRKHLMNVATQTALTGMTTDGYFSATLFLPSLSEQKQISEVFKNLDYLITLYQRKKEAITKQRKTLQQYLLNGIVRVN